MCKVVRLIGKFVDNFLFLNKYFVVETFFNYNENNDDRTTVLRLSFISRRNGRESSCVVRGKIFKLPFYFMYSGKFFSLKTPLLYCTNKCRVEIWLLITISITYTISSQYFFFYFFFVKKKKNKCVTFFFALRVLSENSLNSKISFYFKFQTSALYTSRTFHVNEKRGIEQFSWKYSVHDEYLIRNSIHLYVIHISKRTRYTRRNRFVRVAVRNIYILVLCVNI